MANVAPPTAVLVKPGTVAPAGYYYDAVGNLMIGTIHNGVTEAAPQDYATERLLAQGVKLTPEMYRFDNPDYINAVNAPTNTTVPVNPTPPDTTPRVPGTPVTPAVTPVIDPNPANTYIPSGVPNPTAAPVIAVTAPATTPAATSPFDGVLGALTSGVTSAEAWVSSNQYYIIWGVIALAVLMILPAFLGGGKRAHHEP